MAVAGLGLAALAACSGTARPPALGDTTAASGSIDGSTLNLQPGGSTPTCNLGPNGGVCACVDQNLLGTPPNLYFVLDRSASMSEDNKWQTISNVLEEMVIKLGPRINVGAAVFPDPVNAGCAPGAQVFGIRRGDTPAGQVGPTALSLVTTLGHIGPLGGTPTAATLEALTATVRQLLPTPTYVVLATDGGPNCNPNA